MRHATARDIMTSNPAMVRDNQSIAEVLALFKRLNITGAPVLDESGSLCGLVSLKDIAFDALWHGNSPREAGQGYQVGAHSAPLELPDELHIPSSLKVSDIMTPMVFTVPADASLNRIAEDMSRGRVHRLVVIEHDQVVGIISALDLLKVIRTC